MSDYSLEKLVGVLLFGIGGAVGALTLHIIMTATRFSEIILFFGFASFALIGLGILVIVTNDDKVITNQTRNIH